MQIAVVCGLQGGHAYKPLVLKPIAQQHFRSAGKEEKRPLPKRGGRFSNRKKHQGAGTPSLR